MRILAFDPGLTIGWAYHDEETLYSFGQSKWEEFPAFLKAFDKPIDMVVCEEYQVLPHMAKYHAGSKLETTRAIGAIKFWAQMEGHKLVTFPASLTGQQAKMTGIDPKTKGASHSKTHWVYAYNHGLYLLIKLGLRKTKLQTMKEKK